MNTKAKKVRKESRPQMTAAEFIPIYKPAVLAGKSAKDVAKLLSDFMTEKTQKPVEYVAVDVYQKAAMIRKRLKDEGKDVSIIPSFAGESGVGRRSNIDDLETLLKSLDPVDETAETATPEAVAADETATPEVAAE